MTCHPDHAKSLFTAKPSDAPSLTGDRRFGPILGTELGADLTGDQHMRQRKLLLPPFHGEAVKRYVADDPRDRRARDRQLAAGQTLRAGPAHAGGDAPGDHGRASSGSRAGLSAAAASTRSSRPCAGCCASLRTRCGCWSKPATPAARRRAACCARQGADRPPALRDDRQAPRRRSRRRSHRCPLAAAGARDEQGRPLTDRELRDELATLMLAGHETTANSLAWMFERLLRAPAATSACVSRPAPTTLKPPVRGGDHQRGNARAPGGPDRRPQGPATVAAGRVRVPAKTPVAVSIVALHHRPTSIPIRMRSPRAVPRPQAGYLYVDSLRRRYPSLPGRLAGDGRAARRAGGDRPAHRPTGAGPRASSRPASAMSR